MTVKPLGNGRYQGLSTDTKPTPTNTAVNAIFEETDTNNTQYINDGTAWQLVDPRSEVSYIGYLAGTTYKVINTTTRKVDYSGTNARTVLQSAVDVIKGTGRTLALKGNTVFYMDGGPLELGSNTQIQGEKKFGNAVIRTREDHPAVSLSTSVQAGTIDKVHIKDLYLGSNLSTLSDTTPIVSLSTESSRNVVNTTIEDCYFFDFALNKGIGLKFDCNLGAIYKISLNNCYFSNCKNHIVFNWNTNSTATQNWMNNLSFSNCWFYNSVNAAVKLVTPNPGTNCVFDGNNFINCVVQTLTTATSIGWDYETEFFGKSEYAMFTNCMVWDLALATDGWKFNAATKPLMLGCIPDQRIGGAGVTAGNVQRYSQYSTKTGEATFSGDGTTKTFAVNPGGALSAGSIALAWRFYNVTPRTQDAASNYFWVTPGSFPLFVINYNTAPPTGTNNLKYWYEARM